MSISKIIHSFSLLYTNTQLIRIQILGRCSLWNTVHMDNISYLVCEGPVVQEQQLHLSEDLPLHTQPLAQLVHPAGQQEQQPERRGQRHKSVTINEFTETPPRASHSSTQLLPH